jgi:hypothetical protein
MQTSSYISTKQRMQTTIAIETFKEQINDIFISFESFTRVRNAGMKPKDLMLVNELNVQLLNVFGVTCMLHKKDAGNRDILIAGSKHLNEKVSQLSEDDWQVLSQFVQYMDVALTSDDPLRKVPLMQETVDRDRETFTPDNIQNTFNELLVANATNDNKRQDWEENEEVFHEQQVKDIASHTTAYNKKRRQKQVQPSDSYMYTASDSSNVVKFGSSKNYQAEANAMDDICPDYDDDDHSSPSGSYNEECGGTEVMDVDVHQNHNSGRDRKSNSGKSKSKTTKQRKGKGNNGNKRQTKRNNLYKRGVQYLNACYARY